LDLRTATFLFKLGQVSSLAGVPVPACEAVIGLAPYRWPTPDECSPTVLDVD
jgi:hypothetical protein